MEPYAKMNFYDVNAKLVHRFSESDRLSAVFYWGKDVSNSSPTDSETKFESKSGEIRTKKMRQKTIGEILCRACIGRIQPATGFL